MIKIRNCIVENREKYGDKCMADRKTKKMRNAVFILGAVMILALAGCNSDMASDSDKMEKEQSDNGSVDETKEAQDYDVLKEGDTAPEFTAELVGGGTFTLSEQKGKVVLLNFWATWCGPCVKEMPAFERLKEDYGDDVAILAVDCMEEKETVDKFIKKKGYTFPVAYDVEGMIGMKYPTDGIPYTLVINKDGIVRYIYLGAVDADAQYGEYKSAIEAVLAEGNNGQQEDAGN